MLKSFLDVYPWILLYTIISNCIYNLISNNIAILQLLSVMNLLFSMILSLLMIYYTFTIKRGQKNMLVVKKNLISNLIFLLRITLYIFDGVISA